MPGGGHQSIGVSGGGTDFVPFFGSFGISTVIIRPRLRVDGCEHKLRFHYILSQDDNISSDALTEYTSATFSSRLRC